MTNGTTLITGKLLILVRYLFSVRRSASDPAGLSSAHFLCRKWREAKVNAAEQRAEFEAQTSALDKETQQQWETMVSRWEKDPSLPDPYINEHAGTLIYHD